MLKNVCNHRDVHRICMSLKTRTINSVVVMGTPSTHLIYGLKSESYGCASGRCTHSFPHSTLLVVIFPRPSESCGITKVLQSNPIFPLCRAVYSSPGANSRGSGPPGSFNITDHYPSSTCNMLIYQICLVSWKNQCRIHMKVHYIDKTDFQPGRSS